MLAIHVMRDLYGLSRYSHWFLRRFQPLDLIVAATSLQRPDIDALLHAQPDFWSVPHESAEPNCHVASNAAFLALSCRHATALPRVQQRVPPAGPKNPWDSNHRFTPVQADITALGAGGWRAEEIVFCTGAVGHYACLPGPRGR